MARRIRAKRILELREGGLSLNAVTATGMSKTSVCDVFDAADERGISFADIADMPDDEVYSLLFPGRNNHVPAYEEPDWEQVHRELARTGVTLRLLHGEYADRYADSGRISMGYDRFCKSYRRFTVKSNVTSRVGHKAGRICEVDWSPIMDPPS